MTSSNPFSLGLRAARANLLPGLIIQGLMAVAVLAYYFAPAAQPIFQALADAKAQWGYGYSFASTVIAGAVLPMLFKILVLQRGSVTREDLPEFLFLVLFWGVEGLLIDGFYHLQAMLFGAHADFATVSKKVFVDEFVYTPLFSSPYTLAVYEWKRHGYRFSQIGHVFTGRFYRDCTIPTLCATWALWIPVMSAIYALPLLLQMPLFTLALTFWVLMLAYITASHHEALAHPAAPLAEPVAD